MTELERLKALDLFIATSSQEAVRGFVFLDFINYHFYSNDEFQRIQLFKTNPANLYLHSAIKAQAEQKLIHLIETIRTEENSFGSLPFEISSKWELVNHRDYISHPSTFKWKNKEMANFVDELRHIKSNQAKLIWDAKKEIECFLEKNDVFSKFPIKIDVLEIYVDLFLLLWRDSLVDQAHIPTAEYVKTSLAGFFGAYKNQILEQVLEPDQNQP